MRSIFFMLHGLHSACTWTDSDTTPDVDSIGLHEGRPDQALDSRDCCLYSESIGHMFLVMEFTNNRSAGRATTQD